LVAVEQPLLKFAALLGLQLVPQKLAPVKVFGSVLVKIDFVLLIVGQEVPHLALFSHSPQVVVLFLEHPELLWRAVVLVGTSLLVVCLFDWARLRSVVGEDGPAAEVVDSV
jgi:hypothetical protein